MWTHFIVSTLDNGLFWCGLVSVSRSRGDLCFSRSHRGEQWILFACEENESEEKKESERWMSEVIRMFEYPYGNMCACTCSHIAAQCRRGQAWDWATNHKHVATDPYISFSFLLSLSLSPYPSSFASLSPPLSLVNLPSITSSSPLFSLSISFSLHTLSIFYSNILNPTLHSLCLSSFFLHRPHYLFFFSSLTLSRWCTLFLVFSKF